VYDLIMLGYLFSADAAHKLESVLGLIEGQVGDGRDGPHEGPVRLLALR
jgi:hypothetical protein